MTAWVRRLKGVFQGHKSLITSDENQIVVVSSLEPDPYRSLGQVLSSYPTPTFKQIRGHE